jgi:hypothetical protein
MKRCRSECLSPVMSLSRLSLILLLVVPILDGPWNGLSSLVRPLVSQLLGVETANLLTEEEDEDDSDSDAMLPGSGVRRSPSASTTPRLPVCRPSTPASPHLAGAPAGRTIPTSESAFPGRSGHLLLC